MPLHTVPQYQSALAQVALIRDTAARLAKLLLTTGNQLSTNPLKLLIANTPGDVAYPAKLLGGHGVLTVDAQAWPGGQELGELLASYHAALVAARRAFEAIPVEYLGAITPPPEK